MRFQANDRQRHRVTFGQLANAAGESLGDAIQFSLHSSRERSQPLVVHYERLDLILAGMIGFVKQCSAQAGEDLPITVEGIQIAFRNAAAQMGGDVLEILRLAAVDVARQVEIIVILRVADLGHGYQPRIPGDFHLAGKSVDDAVNILLAQAVFLAILAKAFGCIDHKDGSAAGGLGLIEHNDTGRNAGAVKEVGRQADDALDHAALDQIAADDAFGIAAKQHAVDLFIDLIADIGLAFECDHVAKLAPGGMVMGA